jgi:DNA transposition AAA+ family ATPase
MEVIQHKNSVRVVSNNHWNNPNIARFYNQQPNQPKPTTRKAKIIEMGAKNRTLVNAKIETYAEYFSVAAAKLTQKDKNG